MGLRDSNELAELAELKQAHTRQHAQLSCFKGDLDSLSACSVDELQQLLKVGCSTIQCQLWHRAPEDHRVL
jgi:hypothetical protein